MELEQVENSHPRPSSFDDNRGLNSTERASSNLSSTIHIQNQVELKVH